MNDQSTPAGRASAPKTTRRRGPGATIRAPYRNEVKTRIDDDTYEVMLLWQQLDGAESISAYVAGILRKHFLGMRAMLPSDIARISADASHAGTP